MTTAPDLSRAGTGARAADRAFTHLIDRNAPWLRMIAPGDRLPVPPLVEVDLGPIHLDRLLRTGPVVLLFIRYATSPDCAAALGGYRDTLAPARIIAAVPA